MSENISDKCPLCDKAVIKEEDRVTCDGICETMFHSKCIGFTTSSLKLYRENRNIKYICDECENHPDAALTKTMKHVLSYLCIQDERINRQGKDITNINKNIEQMINSTDENNKGVKEQLANIRMVNKMYADTVIDNVSNIDSTSVSKVVVVKPKANQHCNNTKHDLAQHIDPKAFNVSKVKNFKNGIVVINCENYDSVKKLHQIAAQKLGDRYDIHIPVTRNPKIKIFDITEKFSDYELIDEIKRQNEYLKDGELKVIKIYENKRHNNFGAIVEIDRSSFNKMKVTNKVNIGWNRCSIEECVTIKRCFKCCGFNHNSVDCKNKIACIKCGNEHISKDCDTGIIRCINCVSVNRKFNTQHNVSHPAFSKNCPIYLKKVKSSAVREDRSL